MKLRRSFTFLETIIVILIISIIYSFSQIKTQDYKSSHFTNKLLYYLKLIRYQALVDSKYSLDEELWHKKLWSIKFLKCRSSVGGIYFTIYSDENITGQIKKENSLLNPLTQKRIYSSNYCQENSSNSQEVLITKNFDIQDIKVSCNETSSIGQISFSNKSEVYSKLSNQKSDKDDYMIKEDCLIEIYGKKGLVDIISIKKDTGYSIKN